MTDWFEGGVTRYDVGVTLDEIIRVKPYWVHHGLELEYMAMYDGYIRRKHGLVDSEGYET